MSVYKVPPTPPPNPYITPVAYEITQVHVGGVFALPLQREL